MKSVLISIQPKWCELIASEKRLDGVEEGNIACRLIYTTQLNERDNLLSLVNWMPTADVVEVKHGEWIEKDDGLGGVLYTCSVCDCDWTTIDGAPFENNMRYCNECGAKMDGERK